MAPLLGRGICTAFASTLSGFLFPFRSTVFFSPASREQRRSNATVGRRCSSASRPFTSDTLGGRRRFPATELVGSGGLRTATTPFVLSSTSVVIVQRQLSGIVLR